MEENLDKFDYMIINVEFCLNGRLNSGIVESAFYDSNIKLNDTNRAAVINMVANQLETGKKQSLLFDIMVGTTQQTLLIVCIILQLY